MRNGGTRKDEENNTDEKRTSKRSKADTECNNTSESFNDEVSCNPVIKNAEQSEVSQKKGRGRPRKFDPDAKQNDDPTDPGTEEDISSKEENDENIWSNGNTYSCKPCSIETRIKTDFEKHLEKKHNTSMSRWQKHFIKTDNKYTCKVCSHVTRHDEEEIKRHVECQHMLSLDMYGRLYETNIKLLREKRKLEEVVSTSPTREKKVVKDKQKSKQKLVIQTAKSCDTEVVSESPTFEKNARKDLVTEPGEVCDAFNSSKTFQIPKISKPVDTTSHAEERLSKDVEDCLPVAKDASYSSNSVAVLSTIVSTELAQPDANVVMDCSPKECINECSSNYSSNSSISNLHKLNKRGKVISKGMYQALFDQKKASRNACEKNPSGADDRDEPQNQSLKFKEVRVLLKRVDTHFHLNEDKSHVDGILVPPNHSPTESLDTISKADEKSTSQEEIQCTPNEDLMRLKLANTEIKPEISNGMFSSLVEKRLENANVKDLAVTMEVGPPIIYEDACSIEETFRSKEAVQVIVKKDPDEPAKEVIQESLSVSEEPSSSPIVDLPLLEEDSQMSQVIDDVLLDLDDPESSLTKIMDNFETEDLDALAEIEEGTLDTIPSPELVISKTEQKKGEPNDDSFSESVTSNREENESNSSAETQDVFIYCCPFDKCSFTTSFKVRD